MEFSTLSQNVSISPLPCPLMHCMKTACAPCYVHTFTLIYPPPDTSALVVCRMGWAVLHSKHRAHLTPLGIKRAPPWLNLIFFRDTRLKLSLLNRVVRSRDACQPHPLLYPNSIQLGQSHHHNQSLCRLRSRANLEKEPASPHTAAI